MQNTAAQQLDRDRALIASLGGPAKLSDLLGYERLGGVQRVHNWTVRGIPASVKVQRPDLFMVGMLPEASVISTEATQGAD